MTSLRDMLLEEEGERLTVYDDKTGEPIVPGVTVVGRPTIGRGRCLSTRGISRAEALYLFDNDVTYATKCAQQLSFFWHLDEVRQDVLVAMHFQLGAAGVKEFRRVISAIEKRRFAEAAAEMMESDWARQTPRRAEKLSMMMSTGQYPKEKP